MVSLDGPLTQSYVERLDAKGRAVVYWSCPAGEQVLWRHLRALNEALIPLDDIPRVTPPPNRPPLPDPWPRGYRRVLFRHWDPDVLGALLPVLDGPRFARVIGPTAGLAFNTPNHGGARHVRDIRDLPAPPPGPLRLGPQEMALLRDAMLHASRLRIARFLKGHPPTHAPIDDTTAWTTTLTSEPSADALSISTETGRARWAYVMLLSDGQAARSPEIRAFLLDGADTPDNRVKALLANTVQILRTQGETP